MSPIVPNIKIEKPKINVKELIPILVLLFGGGVIWQVVNWYKENMPPQFNVYALNTLGGKQINTYEITDHIVESEDVPKDSIVMNWGIEVIPYYRGEKSFGEIFIRIKNTQGEILAENKWDNFDKNAEPLIIRIDPIVFQVARIDWFNGRSSRIYLKKRR